MEVTGAALLPCNRQFKGPRTRSVLACRRPCLPPGCCKGWPLAVQLGRLLFRRRLGAGWAPAVVVVCLRSCLSPTETSGTVSPASLAPALDRTPHAASSGQPQLTPASFLEDKQQDFKQVMSSITGQPADWIEVAAKWGQQTTVLVLSQVWRLAAVCAVGSPGLAPCFSWGAEACSGAVVAVCKAVGRLPAVAAAALLHGGSRCA